MARLVGKRRHGNFLREYTDEDGATIFVQACKMGLEGIVSIIENMLAPSAKVSEVARRHGISASLVSTWRRQSRANHVPAAVVLRFAAVQIGEAPTVTAVSTTSEQPRAARGRS